MNTQALLTDLTPEQEEKVSGGIWWWGVYYAAMFGAGAASGALTAWQNRKK
jgi:hypothetical protein